MSTTEDQITWPAPTRAGFYWHRPRPGSRWEPVEVYRPLGDPSTPLRAWGLGPVENMGVVWGPRCTPPRAHAPLSNECTRDPIFLLQERLPVWYPGGSYGATYDPESEFHRDREGRELTVAEAIEAGAGAWTWHTLTVFSTREEGEAWASAREYRYPHGWQVYCVAAEGAMIDLLASATEGGRYR